MRPPPDGMPAGRARRAPVTDGQSVDPMTRAPKAAARPALPERMAERIELWATADLRHYAGNPRNHSPDQVARIAASIDAYGFLNPILVDMSTREIFAGHGRLEAARLLGIGQVPVIPFAHLSAAQRRAYMIADNRLAELSTWDEAKLKIELAALAIELPDMPELGFDAAELGHLLHGDERAAIEDPGPEEPPETPKSRPGDLWLLGGHRLLCGDSTKPDDVARVLGGDRAALFSTDPPYCVDYTGNDRPIHDGKASGKDWSHVYREVDIEDLGEFLDGVFSACLPHVQDDAGIYIWHAHVQQPVIAAAFERHGLLLHQILVWVKPCATFGHCYYRWKHEPCAFGWKRGNKPTHGAGQLETVWEADWEGKQRLVGNEHPIQKPTRLFETPIEQHTKPGDVVLEPFSGSGSQLIAAEKTGRRCRAIEIQPAFVDVAVRRWEKATGKQAVLELGPSPAATKKRAKRRAKTAGGPA